MIKKEKSCGAVCYKIINNQIYYLLEFMQLGHISLPKGHVENNENEKETALREIKEETSLIVILDTSFRKVITYSPLPGVIKDVVFFVGKIISSNKAEDKHDDEVEKLQFFTYKEAYDLLTYASDKEVLQAADEYLRREI